MSGDGSMGIRHIGMVGLIAFLQQPVMAQDRPAAATEVDVALVPYSSSQDSVQLPDGRAIHLVCMGEGSPSVILLAGVVDWSIAWNKVQPAVAAKTRVCAWDRAGLGLSDPPPKPQTVDESAADLQAALRAANIGEPYVLVGHSVGAYETLMLADRHRPQVAGIVLSDPQYPDEVRLMARAAPLLNEYATPQSNPVAEFLERCSAGLRAGSIRKGGPDPEGCLRPQWPPNYPPELKAALNKRLAEASSEIVAAGMDSMAAALSPEMLDRNARMAVNPDRDYGSMPLIVLTAGKANIPPDLPEALKAELPLSEAEWRRAHRELADLSTRGVNRIIADSRHDIPHQNPQAVIDAIAEVVDQVRAQVR
jgi:pimeloyl-ACP methyl ester carboxylesterase